MIGEGAYRNRVSKGVDWNWVEQPMLPEGQPPAVSGFQCTAYFPSRRKARPGSGTGKETDFTAVSGNGQGIALCEYWNWRNRPTPATPTLGEMKRSLHWNSRLCTTRVKARLASARFGFSQIGAAKGPVTVSMPANTGGGSGMSQGGTSTRQAG